MKPKRVKKNETSEAPAIASPLPEPQTAASADVDDKGQDRISINWYVKSDGTMDIDRMRDSMKNRIKEVLPNLVKEFGTKEANTLVEAVQLIPPEWVSTFYDVFGSLEALAFAKILDIDSDTAKTVFKYSALEKEQLVPPTVRIVNKYAPDWLIKYKDEIALAMLLVMMTTTKVAAAKMIFEMKKKTEGASHSNVPSADSKPNGKEKFNNPPPETSSMNEEVA